MGYFLDIVVTHQFFWKWLSEVAYLCVLFTMRWVWVTTLKSFHSKDSISVVSCRIHKCASRLAYNTMHTHVQCSCSCSRIIVFTRTSSGVQRSFSRTGNDSLNSDNTDLTDSPQGMKATSASRQNICRAPSRLGGPLVLRLSQDECYLALSQLLSSRTTLCGVLRWPFLSSLGRGEIWDFYFTILFTIYFLK